MVGTQQAHGRWTLPSLLKGALGAARADAGPMTHITQKVLEHGQGRHHGLAPWPGGPGWPGPPVPLPALAPRELPCPPDAGTLLKQVTHCLGNSWQSHFLSHFPTFGWASVSGVRGSCREGPGSEVWHP